MRKITIHTNLPYDVIIGKGILADCGEEIKKIHRPCTAAIITDDIVDRYYGAQVQESLASSGFSVCKFVFPNGEGSKSHKTLLEIYNFLVAHSLTRSDLIVALGGGVVGDVSGFAAATYQRGIDFIQIPTTFLAAIDSSVGGKTAVNIEAGKNLIGAFWQPKLVWCDTDTLSTLPAAVFADGVAEALKAGAICDASLFELIAQEEIYNHLEEVIGRSVKIKRQVVEADERDKGLRQILNFGHTLGHAIEKHSHFTIPHGHAVAMGMVMVTKASQAAGITQPGCASALEHALNRYNLLNTPIPASIEQLAETCLSDKKRSGQKLTFVLLKELGQCELYPMEIDCVLPFLQGGN